MLCKCGLQIDPREVSKRRGKYILPELCKSCRKKKRDVIRSTEYTKKRAKIHSEYVMNYLKIHPCVDCGEPNPLCLTFDHIKGTKKFNICSKINRSTNFESLKQEISKCEVRCFNCHMLKTAEKNQWWVWRRHNEQ